MENKMSLYPHNKEAEEALLGSVLINPDCFKLVRKLIRKSHFYIIRNNWIWGVYERLRDLDIPIDILTVSDELSKANILDEIGGQKYLLELINNTPSSLHALDYAKKVFECAVMRKLSRKKANSQ